MTVQFTGVSLLTALMRAERRRDLDTSWLLFGPTDEAEAEPEPQPAAKKSAATKISLEDLQQHGYSGGPSVLYVPPPADADPNWTWWVLGLWLGERSLAMP